MEKLEKYKTFDSVQSLSNNVNLFVSKHHLTKSALRILRLIEWYSRKNLGACWLKVKTICEKVGVSDSTVRRSIRKLKELGILKTVTTTRELSGGDGANIYIILPVDNAVDSAEMTDRTDSENTEESMVEEVKSETKYVSTKDVTKKEKEYEKDEFDHTYVRDFVPAEFVKVAKRYSDNAVVIEKLWKKVLMCVKNHTTALSGYEDESIKVAVTAFKQSVFAAKQNSIRGSFYGYFYGVLVKKFVAIQRRLTVERLGFLHHVYF